MVAEFGVAPDLFGDLFVLGGIGVDEFDDLGAVGRGGLGYCGDGQEEDESCAEGHGGSVGR